MRLFILLVLMTSLSTATNLAGPQLEDLRWNYRVVVAKVNSDKQLEKFDTKLQKSSADLKEYRLVVISVYKDTVKAYGSQHIKSTVQNLRKNFINNLAARRSS